jgi:hypothetical protein
MNIKYNLKINMKLFFVLLLTVFLHNNLTAEINDIRSNLELEQTPVFGFTPTISISYPINDNFTLIPYAEYWFQNAYKDTAVFIYPGLELGLGIQFKLFSEKLLIQPSLGIYNGNSFSGSRRFILVDAIVPMLKMDYQISPIFNFNFSARAWLQGREIDLNRATFDDIEINVKTNYSINKSYSLGLFFNQLIVNQKYNNKSILYTSLFVFGPSVILKTDNLSLFIGLGADLVDYIDTGLSSDNRTIKEFYKISANIKL